VLFVSTEGTVCFLSCGAKTPTLPKGHRLAFAFFQGPRGPPVGVIAAVLFFFAPRRKGCDSESNV